ncbi:MAG: MFS transporter [Chitinophagaceae bacterium]
MLGLQKYSSVVKHWALYDWANSVYSLIITTTFLPYYYAVITSNSNNDRITFLGLQFVNTSLYDYALAFGIFIMAIFSPLLSSIADIKGNKKIFLQFFSTLGSVSCIILFFFTQDTITLGIFCIIFSCIGYWGSMVFYNSYLPEIASVEEQDKVSALGFSFGYIGSVLLQIICFFIVIKPHFFGLENNILATRFSFLLVGIWWWVFAFIAIRKLPKHISFLPVKNNQKSFVLKSGYIKLLSVWQEFKKIKCIKLFLIAFFAYNLGVQTIMLIATIYATKTIGIAENMLIFCILSIQLVAIIGAYFMSFLSQKIGNFLTLFIFVLLWIFVSIWGYLLPYKGTTSFIFLSIFIGFLMGGTQSLSRSTYAKIIPNTPNTTSYFSFYNIVAKFSTIFGMIGFGMIEDFTFNMRYSVLFLLVFFVIGAVVLFLIYREQNISYENCNL